METIYIPVRRLLRFARSDSCQTVIAMERLLRQKQSPCLGGRLLRFARSDNRQTIIAMKRLRQWKRFAYRLGDCFASLVVTTAKPSLRWSACCDRSNLHAWVGGCFASLILTTTKPSLRWSACGNGNNLHTG